MSFIYSPQFINDKIELITSVESFQEIIHRYRAINDSEYLGRAYEALEELSEIIVDISKSDVDKARLIAAEHLKLSSRDCLHIAIMRKCNCKKIWTFDKGFECVSGIEIIN
jgi:predicted nucleic acid-binding protein